MARPLRLEYPGALYHVTARGNADQGIFLDDADRTQFLEVLGNVVDRFQWICHGYCLMGNHYHLLVETPAANLSQGMRLLNGVYTQAFNRRHGRSGHVLRGRFNSIVFEKESYLLELARHVVLNPVRAGEARHPRLWKWSSYRATAGETPAPRFLTVDWILDQFGRNRQQSRLAYRKFVAQGRDAPIWDALRGGVLLGSEPFVARLRPLLREKAELKSLPKRARLAARPSLANLFKGAKRDKGRRNERVYDAVRQYGYTLQEVGEAVGLHESTVSRIATRIAQARQPRKGKR